jgi:hypothetical protein
MRKTATGTSSTTPAPAPPAPTSKIFNAASYVKPGLSQAEVEEIKAAFDLFDTDQGGSIDTKGTLCLTQNSRLLWSPWVSMPRML